MKVSELTGEKLAYWVAAALTKRGVMLNGVAHHHDGTISVVGSHYRPDINWSQCGELIEKFKIDVCFNEILSIFECRWSVGDNWISGTTPQEAICRAVVSSVYGEEVNDES